MNSLLVKVVAALADTVQLRDEALPQSDFVLSEIGEEHLDELDTVRMMNAIEHVMNKENEQLIEILTNRSSREYVLCNRMSSDKLSIFWGR